MDGSGGVDAALGVRAQHCEPVGGVLDQRMDVEAPMLRQEVLNQPRLVGHVEKSICQCTSHHCLFLLKSYEPVKDCSVRVGSP